MIGALIGIALIVLCMELVNGYLLLVHIDLHRAASQVKPVRKGHVDLEETRLEKEKAAPTA